MTLTDWSDFHAWDVSPDTMRTARLALSDKAYTALLQAALMNKGNYLVRREAIEAAALAMPPAVGAQWLALVYQLERAEGLKLLGAIQAVHHQ